MVLFLSCLVGACLKTAYVRMRIHVHYMYVFYILNYEYIKWFLCQSQ